ncbi:peptidase [Actinokineospora cianjurensis]|uniref:Prenyltransferase/squalene oxidase-like repeat protein n=1 Tax=Actinokineospora cianjurensis TaxID=585224 RepID=A0A421B2B0_9PSEU|nr:peptidase [Actinokineospora cianjurensis]RLK58532.1 hypothetical protein CLV68_2999 [Actinokineospora cianjurensis]
MRLRSAVLALACAAGAVVAAPTAQATTTHNRADAASGWLARQFVNGDHLETDFGGTSYPDAGLTIDAVFAFASSGTANDYGAAALTWLAQPTVLSGYIGDGTEAYAGATAKTALAVQVRGGNPTSFGGVNLITRLNSLLTPSGRFSDQSIYGDYSNAFTQSLAVIALDRTAAGAPVSAVNFTAGTQCPDGGFPIVFGAPTCASDTDATAVVVQALLATGRTAAAQQGLTWLKSKQQANGGLAYGDGSGTPNTNTTGLAGQAFRAGGRLPAALKSRQYVLSLQANCTAPVPDRGAIAYDSTGLNPSTVTRATAQATLALRGAPFATLTSTGSTNGAPTLAC